MPREHFTSYQNRRIERLERRVAVVEAQVMSNSNVESQLGQDVDALESGQTAEEQAIATLEAKVAAGGVDPALVTRLDAVVARMKAETAPAPSDTGTTPTTQGPALPPSAPQPSGDTGTPATGTNPAP